MSPKVEARDSAEARHAFAARLSKLRSDRRNLPLIEIRQKIGPGIEGVSTSALSRIFSGTQLPTMTVLEAILEALGVTTPADFAQWEELRKRADQGRKEPADTGSSQDDSFKARFLLNRSRELATQSGLSREARHAAQLSIDMYRQLVSTELPLAGVSGDLGTHVYGLAQALGHHASLLAEAGEFEEAREAATESVDLFSKLTVIRGDFEEDLAQSYAILGECLSKAGDHQRAVHTLVASAEILIRLTANGTVGRHMGNTARVLGRIGTCLALADQAELAAEMIQWSLELQLRLPVDEQNRDDIARAWHNLGFVHASAQEWDAAYEAAKESVRIYRGLAATEPHEYSSKLAGAEGNLKTLTDERGRRT